jgi:tetratricopeptide (TPR) repeat protein
MLARDGKFREADDIMAKICEREPRGPEHWFTRAEFLYAAGKLEAALKYYYVVRELSPGHSVSHFNCGNILSKLGKYNEAVECYNKALKYEKTMTGAMNNKGLALSCLGNHKEAYDCFRRVLIAQPNNADALFNKGYELSKLERFEEAVQTFDSCLSVANDRDLIERARAEKASALKQISE